VSFPVYTLRLASNYVERATNLGGSEMSPAAFTALVNTRRGEGNDSPIEVSVLRVPINGSSPLVARVKPSDFVSVS
jgi:hypothetical protein